MTCTWVDCTEAAAHPQIGKDGKQWAHLCQAHHDQLEGHIKNGEAKHVLSAWVRAQGGSKKATEAMRPEIEKATKLFGALIEARKKFDTRGW